MIHDLIPCSLIHHFAVLHNDQLVCHVSSYTNVMGYDDDACVEIVTQFHHLTDDLRLCGHINALVGSSARSSSGLKVIAMAIPTR